MMNLNNIRQCFVLIVLNFILIGCSGTEDGDTTTNVTPPTISIAGVSVNEGNTGTTNLDFVVSLTSSSTSSIQIDYQTSDLIATTLANDYVAKSGTLTIPAGSTTATISVSVTGDSLFEAQETFQLAITNPTNATLSATNASAVGTIENDDAIPSINVATASTGEGDGTLSFQVSVSNASYLPISFDFATSDKTALSGVDYTANTGSVTIAPGLLTGSIAVSITDDSLYELNETLDVTISNVSNAVLGTATVTGSIVNNDTAPTLIAAAQTVNEANSGTNNNNLNISISAVVGFDVVIQHALLTSNASSTDFTYTAGSITITAGSTTAIVPFGILGDTDFEPSEDINILLSSNLGSNNVTTKLTIINDDARPVTMTLSGKALNFSWQADSFISMPSNNIDHYRILENPDGISGFTVIDDAKNIANSKTNFRLEIPVHKTDWLSARYMMEACDAGALNCVSSNTKTLNLIDSIATTVYIKAANVKVSDSFGHAVSISDDGNVLAIGVPNNDSSGSGINSDATTNGNVASGAVMIFKKSGSTWIQSDFIKASNPGNYDYFGFSVALSADGKTLAVGAKWEDSNSTGINSQENNLLLDSGAAYIYVDTTSGWAEQAYLKAASHPRPKDEFGISIAISNDGNTVAVGAELEDNGASTHTQNGSIYVFTRSGQTWSQEAKLVSSNNAAGIYQQLGHSIAISSDGNTIVSGAYKHRSSEVGIRVTQTSTSLNAILSGAVYVFSRSSSTWTQQAYIKASNSQSNDQFGFSVAISDDGDTIAVGAIGEDSAVVSNASNESDNSQAWAGAVYTFNRTGSTWTQNAFLKAEVTTAYGQFGWSISLSGDSNSLAVGVYGDSSSSSGVNGSHYINGTTYHSGAAYLFTKTNNSWSQKSFIKASNTAKNDLFGGAVSLNSDGNSLLISAIGEDSSASGINGDQTDNSKDYSGAVYLY